MPKRVNGPFTLYMTVTGGNKLPFGNLPRLILAWLCTEAVRTQNRELVLGKSLADLMRALGVYSTSGGKYTRLRNQMKRLFGCSISLVYGDARRETTATALIADFTDFWWNERKPDEPMLWDSKIYLGEAFFNEIIAGLEKDAPRPGRKPRITAKLVRELIAKTTQQTPPNATHWSTRSMAAAMGISAASVRRIWRAHGLKPHRTATFKLSNDPRFAEKLEDVVGLYLNPPEHGQGQIPGGVRSGQLLDKTPAQPRRDLAQLDPLLLAPSQKRPTGRA